MHPIPSQPEADPGHWRNLPPDPLLDSLRVRVLTAHHHRLNHQWNGTHAHDPFDRLYHVTAGTAIMAARGKTVELRPGTTYLIPALTSHRHQCATSVTMYWCHIVTTTDGERGFFEHALDIHAHVGDSSTITTTFARLCQACDDASPAAALTRSSCALELLAPFAAVGQQAEEAQERAYFTPVLEAIDASGPDGALSVAAMARLVGLSSDRFSKRFASLFGMTPAKYRQRRCLAQAQRLLAESDLTIDAVARQCGFCDGFHLSKVFRRILHTTPSSYRTRGLNPQP